MYTYIYRIAKRMTFWYHFLAQASKMQAGPSNMYSLNFRMPVLEQSVVLKFHDLFNLLDMNFPLPVNIKIPKATADPNNCT